MVIQFNGPVNFSGAGALVDWHLFIPLFEFYPPSFPAQEEGKDKTEVKCHNLCDELRTQEIMAVSIIRVSGILGNDWQEEMFNIFQLESLNYDFHNLHNRVYEKCNLE